MQHGLEGIRVLEIAGGVGLAYAAKLFADLGADVVRVEQADGEDTVRSRPHDVHYWLNTNKRATTDEVGPLAGGADIVLHDRGPASAAAAHLSHAELGAANPALVLCSITAFGMTGPYADLAAEELTVIHGSSWGFLSPSASTRRDLPPLKAPGHHAWINTATIAATVALAAFDHADRTGRGTHVDFSVFAAAAKMTETAPVSASYQQADASRLGVKIVVPWNIYPCKDGLVQFICPEQTQWDAAVTLMGEPDWARLDLFATGADRRENSDLIDVYLAEWTSTQRVADLVRDAQAARVCISPVSTMAQLDTDAHFRERGFFATTPDGRRVPGPGFRTDQRWWALRRAAPGPGEHDGEGWLPRQGATRPLPDDAASVAGLPLDGVRVCDFSWIWAGPFCTQELAHLGADVIKLESAGHLCLFRRLPYAPTGMELTPDTAGVFHLYNSDKRSLGIDLGHVDARQIVERLVAVSDVVVDNFAVGTMAKLGYGIEELRRINPNVVVVSLSGYGQTGPDAGNMAYGPVGGAVAGLYAATGYEGGRAAETGIAVGDPGTGIAAAWAVVAALAARRRNGEVAGIDVAMVEAVAATVGEPWMQYQSTGSAPLPAGNHDFVWSPHNCYPASGDDRWVTIACTTERSWLALCSVVDPALAQDPRFDNAALRKRNESCLDEIVSAWTRSRERWDVTAALQAVGVAAFPSLSPLDLWSGDAQLEALGMLEQPEHRAVGARTVPGIPWRLTPGPNGLRRPAPLLGQDTAEVLTGLLGYTAGEVADLVDSGAVTMAAVHDRSTQLEWSGDDVGR